MQKETRHNVNTIHRQLRHVLVNSLAVIGLSWGLDQKKNGAEPYTDKPDGSWDRTAEEIMLNFSGSGHPIFRASSAFARGEVRSKAGGKKSIHFNGSTETIELLLRTVVSANQLSIFGTMADLCDEVPKRVRTPEKPAAPKHLEKVEILSTPRQNIPPMTSSGETNGKSTSENSSNCQKTRSYPNCVLMRV